VVKLPCCAIWWWAAWSPGGAGVEAFCSDLGFGNLEMKKLKKMLKVGRDYKSIVVVEVVGIFVV
jgi:hypothetical protein